MFVSVSMIEDVWLQLLRIFVICLADTYDRVWSRLHNSIKLLFATCAAIRH